MQMPSQQQASPLTFPKTTYLPTFSPSPSDLAPGASSSPPDHHHILQEDRLGSDAKKRAHCPAVSSHHHHQHATDATDAMAAAAAAAASNQMAGRLHVNGHGRGVVPVVGGPSLGDDGDVSSGGWALGTGEVVLGIGEGEGEGEGLQRLPRSTHDVRVLDRHLLVRETPAAQTWGSGPLRLGSRSHLLLLHLHSTGAYLPAPASVGIHDLSVREAALFLGVLLGVSLMVPILGADARLD